MGAYLPRDYDPIPDEALAAGADVFDVVRRVARNQNYLWAHSGAVYAAFGHEPANIQSPTITGGGATYTGAVVGRIAAPIRSRTGSDYLRVNALVVVSGTLTTVDGLVRLYQLLPGETEPTAITPYDDGALGATIGDYRRVSFAARVRVGVDPLRLVVGLFGAGTATYQLASVVITWESAAAGSKLLGETVLAPAGLSQAYPAAGRTVSAPLLRSISGMTLGLWASDTSPVFSHSFLWPRMPSSAVAVAKLAAYDLAASGSRSKSVRIRYLLVGQGAVARFRVTNAETGVTSYSTSTAATAISNGVYMVQADVVVTGITASVIDVYGDVTTAGTASQPATFIGLSIVGVTIVDETPALTLPGTEMTPNVYQPLDDLACAPKSSIVVNGNRLDRSAGIAPLISNLIWLAANRRRRTIVADWLSRTQHAGYGTGTAGDGFYRSQTVWQFDQDYVGQEPRAGAGSDNVIGWADRAGPTNANEISDGGHHYPGAKILDVRCRRLTGGRFAFLCHPLTGLVPGAPAAAGSAPYLWVYERTATLGTMWKGALNSTSIGPTGVLAGRSHRGADEASASQEPPFTFHVEGGDLGSWVALSSSYVYEEPLTQADLDAVIS